MHRTEFNALVEAASAAHPRWFSLERDPPATEHAIAEAERRLGVRLPEEYRSFLLDHGGGYFAFALVFGVDAASDWYVVARNSDRDPSFVAVSDPGTGTAYGFHVGQDGRCASEIVLHDHETQAFRPTPYADLYEMLSVTALTPRPR